MVARRFTQTRAFSLNSIVILTVLTGSTGNVIPVTKLGDPCTKPAECEETIADSTCVFNTCHCKEGYEQIGDNFCDHSSDGQHYNIPSQKPILMCNKPGRCDFIQNTCKTKFTRRLLGLRDTMKATAGSVLSGFCGLNIQLNFSKTEDTSGKMNTVNTLCYIYESPYGSFSVAEIKVKEPSRKYPGSVESQVTCTAGKDSCNQYRFSGFVVGFFAGVPADCFRDLPNSTQTSYPDLPLILLTALVLILSRQFHV